MTPIGVGGDKIEVASFRRNEDFKIKYGKEQKEVTIPRLGFTKGEEVIRIISVAMSKDAAGALEIIGMSYKRKEKGADDKAFKKMSIGVERVINNLLQYKMFGMLKDLLFEVSEEAFTEEMISECQFTEAAGILNYLLDENLSSLKNLFASLEVITSSEKQLSA